MSAPVDHPGLPLLLRLLCANVYEVYRSCLVGNPCAAAVAMMKYLNDVAPGRLVMETSTIWRPERDAARIGWLLRIEQRQMYTAAEWNEVAEGRPIPTEPVHVLRPLTAPGSTYDWTNASFIAVPEDLFPPGFFDERAVESRIYPGTEWWRVPLASNIVLAHIDEARRG